MSKYVLEKIKKNFSDFIIDTSDFRGDETVILKKEKLLDVMQFLKNEPNLKFDMPIDVTCVDYLKYKNKRPFSERFCVVYHLYSTEKKHRIRIKVPVDGEEPSVDSVVSVWRGVNWFEREVYDMFGIKFVGHPDLRRILLYPEFKGYPLRKDYPLKGYQPRIPMPRLEGDPLPWEKEKDEEE